MQLAYGKFDPDLNPPPFSDWSKALTAVEIDLFQYYSWKPKVAAYFNSWVKRKGIRIIPRLGIRTQRAPEEYRDAVGLWSEMHHKETLYFLVHSGRKQWTFEQSIKEIKKLPFEKYFFEWGKSDSTQELEFIKSFDCFHGWVIDPDWHRSSMDRLRNVPIHYKLHGWSDERWIRRYGESQALRILRTVKKQDAVLTLSYSGKVLEAPLFAGTEYG